MNLDLQMCRLCVGNDLGEEVKCEQCCASYHYACIESKYLIERWMMTRRWICEVRKDSHSCLSPP